LVNCFLLAAMNTYTVCVSVCGCW